MRRTANKTLDRMTRSAVSRTFQSERPWRAPRHRSALRSAVSAGSLSRVLLGAVVLLASSGTAFASRPTVEPWMHVTNFSVAALLGLSAAAALRRRPRTVSSAVGIGVFLLSVFGGFILCIVASMH